MSASVTYIVTTYGASGAERESFPVRAPQPPSVYQALCLAEDPKARTATVRRSSPSRIGKPTNVSRVRYL